MKELSEAKPLRPLDPSRMGGETAAIKSMLDMLNNPEVGLGAKDTDIPSEVPNPNDGPHGRNEPSGPHEGEQTEEAPAPPRPVPAPALPRSRKPVGSCLLLSGRLAAGKDYIAEKAEAKIFGFADPLYVIATVFCGVEVTATQNKDLPGMRAFLQQIGQWGRGTVNAQYPYTAERGIFTQLIRSMGARGNFKNPEVDWSKFGLDDSIWIKAANTRVGSFITETPGKRVAITNARFENEIKYFRALPEWDHWHVICSQETWTERLAKKKLTPQSKEVNDISEQIALALDRDVLKKIKQPGDNMLRVIWNDHRPCPSKRIYTLPMFLQEVALAEAVPVVKTDLEIL